jgi:NADPH:quinone reductase-like Zn-dependent oxidoreductase
VSKLATKSHKVSFEQAASVLVAALTALQRSSRQKERFNRFGEVLINSAAGGVGTFAVQIAKSLGAEVTGVSSTKKCGHGSLDRRGSLD